LPKLPAVLSDKSLVSDPRDPRRRLSSSGSAAAPVLSSTGSAATSILSPGGSNLIKKKISLSDYLSKSKSDQKDKNNSIPVLYGSDM